MPEQLSEVTVGEVMTAGIIDCPPQTPLNDVASLMAENSIHAVMVEGLARGRDRGEELVWGVVSDVDLMRAAATTGLGGDAGAVAATEIVTIERGESVQRAAQLMGEHDCSHLIVIDPASGRPLGVVSSLDVARALVRESRTNGDARVR